MSGKSLAFFATLIATSLFAMGSQAATIVYNQPSNGNLLAVSAVLNAPSDPGFQWTSDRDTQNWQYFSVPSALSFDQITWYGSNADGNFAVGLFGVTCFSCSATQVSGGGTIAYNILPDPGPFSPSQIQKTQISTNIYSYTLNLGASVALGASTPTSAYALTVVNNYTSAPFVWGASNTGGGSRLNFTIGQAMFLRGPGYLAFTLASTAVAPPPTPTVPLPAAGLLLLTGMGGFGVVALRRNRSTGQSAAG